MPLVDRPNDRLWLFPAVRAMSAPRPGYLWLLKTPSVAEIQGFRSGSGDGYGTCASSRSSVTVKKKRKADTAAFMLVGEAPMDRMCS